MGGFVQPDPPKPAAPDHDAETPETSKKVHPAPTSQLEGFLLRSLDRLQRH
jgi:hypothetical protein